MDEHSPKYYINNLHNGLYLIGDKRDPNSKWGGCQPGHQTRGKCKPSSKTQEYYRY
ncbi:MAG: hypothetical protein ACMG6E_06360 [Candidatus Roizmanbacteria bacterium]